MMRKISFVCALLLFAPAIASAQSKTAKEWFSEGEKAYTLADFADAIVAFKKAFEIETSESNKAIYLYNIAQSYRFMKDCANAQFFYRRYLELREKVKPPDAKHRAEIEARIKELETCVRLPTNPPTGPQRLEAGENESGDEEPKKDVATPDSTDDTGEGTDEEPLVSKPVELGPRAISLRLVGGAAKIIATDQLSFPVQATGALIGGYPLALNENVTLEFGAGFTFTPLSFKKEVDGMEEDKTANLIGLVGNFGATYHPVPKVGLRGDLGLGALFFTGVSESLFTDNRETSGALTMFHVRVGLSADYAVTPNFIVTATPIAFSYSPAKSGLREDIDSIRAFDFMAGVGYRM